MASIPMMPTFAEGFLDELYRAKNYRNAMAQQELENRRLAEQDAFMTKYRNAQMANMEADNAYRAAELQEKQRQQRGMQNALTMMSQGAPVYALGEDLAQGPMPQGQQFQDEVAGYRPFSYEEQVGMLAPFLGPEKYLELNKPKEGEWLSPTEAMYNGQPSMVQVEKNTGKIRPLQGVSPVEKKPLVQVNTGEAGQGLKFDNVFAIQKEYNSRLDKAKINDIEASYGRIKAAAVEPSAAGDLALIFNYMKMLDPGSTVREGEFANAQNAAGIPDRVRNIWNRSVRGERLSSDQRKDFLRQAERQYEVGKKKKVEIKREFSDLAKRYKVDPALVVGEEQNSYEDIKEIGGKTYFKMDGKWYER